MLRYRPQATLGAADTRQDSSPSPAPYKHQGSSLIERIDYIISASNRTNSLEIAELRYFALDVVAVLQDAKSSIAA